MTSPAYSLPADEMTERCLLGAILLDGDLMDSMRSTLEAEDFTIERRREVWNAMCAAYDRGVRIDNVVVYQELCEKGSRKDTWLTHLNELTEGVPMLPSFDRYVEVLKEKAALRSILKLADHTIKSCLAGTSSAGEIQELLLQRAQEIMMQDVDKKPVSTRDLVDRIGIDGILNPRRSKTGVRLPWGRLQHSVNGFQPGQLIVCAAYTSRGKTSLACQIAVNCTRQARGVIYWTTEMTPEALFRRMVHQMCSIDGMSHRQGTLTKEQTESATQSVAWLYDHPIWFDFRSRTVQSFLASLRQIQQKHEIGLAIIDHIQHVKCAGRAGSRAQEVSDISRSLKMAALDFEMPVMALSQVSRPKEDNANLTIHAIKESGDVENDADVVLLLNSAKPEGLKPVSVSLNVAKQREGPAGFDVPMIFHPSTQVFESVEEM